MGFLTFVALLPSWWQSLELSRGTRHLPSKWVLGPKQLKPRATPLRAPVVCYEGLQHKWEPFLPTIKIMRFATEERKYCLEHGSITEDFGVETRKSCRKCTSMFSRLDAIIHLTCTQISPLSENYDYTEAPLSQVGMGSGSRLAGDPLLCWGKGGEGGTTGCGAAADLLHPANEALLQN